MGSGEGGGAGGGNGARPGAAPVGPGGLWVQGRGEHVQQHMVGTVDHLGEQPRPVASGRPVAVGVWTEYRGGLIWLAVVVTGRGLI